MDVQYDRPTEPKRADCGHLCNCYPEQHPESRRTIYVHDIVDSMTGIGTECGPCYTARMTRETAGLTFNDMVSAFSPA